MKNFLMRVALKRLSNDRLMALYQSLNRGMIQLEMQRHVSYWNEEGVVAGMSEAAIYNMSSSGVEWANKELENRVALRALVMSARPQLFANHRADYLAPYREPSVLKYFWEARETHRKYLAIMAERETKTSYNRDKS